MSPTLPTAPSLNIDLNQSSSHAHTSTPNTAAKYSYDQSHHEVANSSRANEASVIPSRLGSTDRDKEELIREQLAEAESQPQSQDKIPGLLFELAYTLYDKRDSTAMEEVVDRLAFYQPFRIISDCISLLEAQYQFQILKKNFVKAEDLCRKCWMVCIDHFGEHDQDSLYVQSQLGWILFAQERFLEAEALLRRVLRNCKRSLGIEHTTTLDALTYLSRVLADHAFYRATTLFSQ